VGARRLRGYASTVRTSWPETVERVADVLRRAGAEARLEEFEDETPTAADAARAAACGTDQIVKSVVLVVDGRPVVALVPGDRRADTGKIARAVGARKARIASPEEVVAATGFAPGAVAPFPLPGVERVLAERTLLTHPVVWIGAGSPRHLAAIAPRELLRLSRADPVDVVQESAYDSSSLDPGGS
jgi:prolyl-tRNA editing enzyme YbaK/EbsC (Cys-tRNA(Pro) deacylase)